MRTMVGLEEVVAQKAAKVFFQKTKKIVGESLMFRTTIRKNIQLSHMIENPVSDELQPASHNKMNVIFEALRPCNEMVAGSVDSPGPMHNKNKRLV